MPYGSVGPANAARQQQRQTQSAGRQSPQQANPMENFLFGPTQRAAEPVTAGAPFGPGPGQFSPQEVPAAVRRSLPLLQSLAADPDAPPQLRDMVNLLVYRAG